MVDIDSLTLGQAKELAQQFAPLAGNTPAAGIEYPIGKYCIIRTYASGVWCAVLDAYDSATNHAVLSSARRLWSWEGAFTLSTVAVEGVKAARMPAALERVIVARVEELIPASAKAEKQLREMEIYRP